MGFEPPKGCGKRIFPRRRGDWSEATPEGQSPYGKSLQRIWVSIPPSPPFFIHLQMDKKWRDLAHLAKLCLADEAGPFLYDLEEKSF
ncbi:MAG: hypothetical protein WAK60_09860 [Sedimentisphaerales bacterium]